MTQRNGWVARVDNGQVTETRDLGPEPIDVKDSILPLAHVNPPVFDMATQVAEGPVYTVGPDQVTMAYNVRAKNAAELDAEKETQLNIMQRLVFEVNFDQENRLRVLEGKPAITKAQYRNALKAAL